MGRDPSTAAYLQRFTAPLGGLHERIDAASSSDVDSRLRQGTSV